MYFLLKNADPLFEADVLLLSPCYVVEHFCDQFVSLVIWNSKWKRHGWV